jgi:hypothetical protein
MIVCRAEELRVELKVVLKVELKVKLSDGA